MKYPNFKTNIVVRSAIVLILILTGLVASTAVMARGGQAADDCPAGSKDPDCK